MKKIMALVLAFALVGCMPQKPTEPAPEAPAVEVPAAEEAAAPAEDAEAIEVEMELEGEMMEEAGA